MSKPPRNEELVEIAAEIIKQTRDAYLLSDGDREVWVQKRLVTDNLDGTFSMPEWMALNKGLI